MDRTFHELHGDGARFATIGEVIDEARRTLPRELWDYVAGGAGHEVTLRRNRMALDAVQFRPRVLRDVGERQLVRDFIGLHLRQPVMLAPVGGIAEFHPDGALACARVARAVGSVAWVSSIASPDLETVARSGAALVLQVYVRGDRPAMGALIERAEDAGYRAICLTVDSAVYSRRERDLRNRFSPRERKARPNLSSDDRQAQATLTWKDLEWFRRKTGLPLVLKGVLDPRDARLAVDSGVDGIVVSNHGGRQLDSSPAAIEVLAEVVDAVVGDADVAVDGGFVSGTDVVKALALGAKAVLIGKLQCWALAAGGEPALRRVLELLAEETSLTLGLLGVTSVDELSPDVLRLPPRCHCQDPGSTS